MSSAARKIHRVRQIARRWQREAEETAARADGGMGTRAITEIAALTGAAREFALAMWTKRILESEDQIVVYPLGPYTSNAELDALCALSNRVQKESES
ncbi:MAG: hypothetical protein WKG01_07685 [Kofleriaceae bacterium]